MVNDAPSGEAVNSFSDPFLKLTSVLEALYDMLTSSIEMATFSPLIKADLEPSLYDNPVDLSKEKL